MFRRILVLCVCLSLTLVLVPSALAITHGQLDGEGHPYVGMLAFQEDATGRVWRCTGTLLSPTVVLTAGHCTAGAARAWASFKSDIGSVDGFFASAVAAAKIYTMQGYDGFASFPATYDLGIVILAQPVVKSTYGALPAAGFLDTLATRRGLKEINFTVVGYGLQDVKPQEVEDLARYWGSSQLVNLRSHINDGYNLQTTNGPGKGTGSGGACSGDSGGPIFYGTTNIVVAVTSFGMNGNCAGADFSFRVDRPDSLAFIAAH